MKKLLLSFFLCAAALVQLASCSGKKYRLPVRELTVLCSSGNEVTVQAEIARTEDERSWGFMKRRHIPEGTGMLFVFERDQVLSFWMKNTPHPLSIAYIDSGGIIRGIYDMTPYSLSPVKSPRSVQYALEVPQGWYEKAGITAGDRLVLPGSGF